jgi:hypothetical protein
MAIHDQLPIHKTGSQLLGVAARIHAQMRRGYKRSVGEKIVDNCAEMLDLMALANAAVRDRAQRTAHIQKILSHQRAATTWLRIAFDLKLVPHGLWGEATQLLQGVGKQANGWLTRTNEKAPAA